MSPSRFGFLALLIAAVPAALRAQSGSSAQSQEQSQPPPQAQPSKAPQSGETPGNAPKAEPGKGKKPKKVWTEDDMGKLGNKVSVVGGSNSATTANGPARSGSRDTSYYRDRLTPLRQQLERIETQIRDLQTAKLGGRENIARSLERLEAQKKEVQGKIDAVEDEARKDGIEPGQLR